MEAGASAETAADLFAAKMGAMAFAKLKTALPSVIQFQVKGDVATVPTAQGEALTFRQAEGRWGYAGFASESEEMKRRAIADLELIKTSATDYERARARSAP